MADTIENIDIPPNVWVDLYAESGIAVGTALSVQNVGVADVQLTVLATEPPIGHDAYSILLRAPSVPYRNEVGDSGAWAFCPNDATKLNVRAAL